MNFWFPLGTRKVKMKELRVNLFFLYFHRSRNSSIEDHEEESAVLRRMKRNIVTYDFNLNKQADSRSKGPPARSSEDMIRGRLGTWNPAGSLK